MCVGAFQALAARAVFVERVERMVTSGVEAEKTGVEMNKGSKAH
jgi:hypothetical protein